MCKGDYADMFKLITKIIVKLKNSFLYSIDGLKAVFEAEMAFRMEVCAGIIAIPLALFLGKSALERMALISSILLVFIIELLNSAIETTLNKVDLNWDPLIKKAKDMGSAAVLITLINALVVWGLTLFSH